METNKTKKASAKERYEKEYEFGMKHQPVLQLINIVGRKIVYQDLLTKILIDSGYCNNRAGVTRLIQRLENNKLVVVYRKKGFNLIQIRKLGILVAENKTDMDSVSARGDCANQSIRDEKIEFRMNYFYYKYIQKLQMPLNKAMKDVLENDTHTLFNNPLVFYEMLKKRSSRLFLQEIDAQIEHIKTIKKSKSKEMKTLRTENKPVKTEKITRIDTLERFARREVFIDSCTFTKQNEIIANVVVFNIADELRTKKINTIKDMLKLLSSLGIKHCTITIVNRTDKLASGFYKNNKVNLPFQFAYFDDDFNMKFINTHETSEQIAARLEQQYADRLERDRQEQLERQRKLEEQRKIEAEREAKRKANKYYGFDFSTVLRDESLIRWITTNLEVQGFESIIDYILNNIDDFNELDNDLNKLLEIGYDHILMKSTYYNKRSFINYSRKSFKNLVKAHRTYVKLRDEFLLNRKVKHFKQYEVKIDETGEIKLKKTDSVYRKTKEDFSRIT